MADWVLSIFVVTGAVIYLRAAMNLERLQVGDALGPQVFPSIVAICMLCSGLLLAWETWRKQMNPEGSAPPAPKPGDGVAHPSADRRRHQMELREISDWPRREDSEAIRAEDDA